MSETVGCGRRLWLVRLKEQKLVLERLYKVVMQDARRPLLLLRARLCHGRVWGLAWVSVRIRVGVMVEEVRVGWPGRLNVCRTGFPEGLDRKDVLQDVLKEGQVLGPGGQVLALRNRMRYHVQVERGCKVRKQNLTADTVRKRERLKTGSVVREYKPNCTQNFRTEWAEK